METLQNNLGEVKKQIEMLRGRNRRSDNGHIMWPVKKIITMLALLDATRDTIGIVMGLPRHSRITRHLKLPLMLDQICGIVQETLTAWPNFVLEAQSIHPHVRLHCQRQLNECRTAMWLLEQNKKGIAVLPRLALEYYVRLWGCRPYTKLVEEHLSKFNNALFNKKWYRMFRVNWNFDYAKMPVETALAKDDIDRKVLL
jgi:hypothetical protein